MSLIFPMTGLILIITIVVFFYFLVKLDRPRHQVSVFNIQGDGYSAVYDDDEPLIADQTTVSRPAIAPFCEKENQKGGCTN